MITRQPTCVVFWAAVASLMLGCPADEASPDPSQGDMGPAAMTDGGPEPGGDGGGGAQADGSPPQGGSAPPDPPMGGNAPPDPPDPPADTGAHPNTIAQDLLFTCPDPQPSSSTWASRSTS